MQLEDEDLNSIRDYVGADSPTDDELAEYAETLTYWQEVALRVLRRRRAGAAGGDSVTSFSLTGVLSLGQRAADLGTIEDAIRDLERQLTDITGESFAGGVSVTRIQRLDRRR